MNRMNLWKRHALWLAGLALALPAGTRAAADAPIRCRCAPPAADAAAAKDRYYVFGQSSTRVGDRWVFLGAYDSADEAAKAAKAVKAGEDARGHYECKVTSGANLQLPPAEEASAFWVNRVARDGTIDYKSQARYATFKEAAAAAEKIVADGDMFSVTYDMFSKPRP